MNYLPWIVHLIIGSIITLVVVLLMIFFNVTNPWALIGGAIVSFIIAYPISKKIAASMRG